MESSVFGASPPNSFDLADPAQKLGAPTDPRPLVLHVRVVRASGGGPEKTILRSARHVDASRYRMAAAYIHPAGDPGYDAIRQRAAAEQCPLFSLPEHGPLDPRTVTRLLRLCRQQRVAIWHGHDYKSNLLGLLLRRWHPLRLVTTVHGWTWDTVRTRLYYHLDNACLPRYEQVVVVSPPLLEHARKLGVNEAGLSYIPNAIDPAEYVRQHDRAAACASLKLPAAALHIGVVGRLSVEKGADRAVRLLAQLPAATHLHLIGDGPQRPALEQLVAQLRLAERVHFHGWQKQSQRWYEAFDLLLLPSHTEGLPNVVLEAMAMGVPTAATDVGGVRDLLADGACGLILPPTEPQAWSPPVTALLQNAPQRARFAQLARQRIESHFTFTARMRRMMQVYERLNLHDAKRQAA